MIFQKLGGMWFAIHDAIAVSNECPLLSHNVLLSSQCLQFGMKFMKMFLTRLTLLFFISRLLRCSNGHARFAFDNGVAALVLLLGEISPLDLDFIFASSHRADQVLCWSI
jgi:hypothetical protein